jgi:DNA mismatch repair protein MutS
MSLVKEYFDLTKKYQDEYGENTILLMLVGSFYEVYGMFNKKTEVMSGSKIIEFSSICDLSVVDKNTCVGKDASESSGTDSSVMMAGFKDFQIEKYIKKIQGAGFTCVVYKQDEAGKNTTRSLEGIFSPGTYFSPDVNKLTNNLTCIWIELINNIMILKGKFVVVGIANIDIYTGKTSIFQFKEMYINNPTTYDELERFISIYNPSEAIIIHNLPEKEIDDIISFTNINCELIHRVSISNDTDSVISNRAKHALNCEKQIYQKEVLNKFYKISDFGAFIQNFNEHNIATQAFCYLLDFVYQHSQHLLHNIDIPVFENCSDRLVLANHSLKQLNIIDDHNSSGKYSSVLKMLNEALTPMGKRKFAYNFLNPITNCDSLRRKYDITEYFLKEPQYSHYSSFLYKQLSEIKDISKLERQVFLKKIAPSAFYILHNNIQNIKTIYNKIHGDAIIISYLKSVLPNINIDKIGECCDNIIEYIVSNVDLNLARDIDNIQSFDTNFILPGVDNELDKHVDNLFDAEMRLDAICVYLSGLIESKDKKSKKNTEFIKLNKTEKNNYSLVATSRRCKLLQDALPSADTIVSLGYNLPNINNKNNTINNITKSFEFKISKNKFEFSKQSASNNFIKDTQIDNLCKNISQIKTSFNDIIKLVYNRFIEKFEGFQDQINNLIHFITCIDMLYAKSTLAKKYNYCKPVIDETAEKSFVNAKQLRHCLIERFQSNELYVSNDLIIGDGSIDGLLLYGTNAVGKTSFIRALGIAVIMAQAGLFVPCTEFTYKPYNYIFTRILGNDNIFKGLSTFAVEMSELRTILRLADKNSLVLGDELCSGTETMSAISIFVAGIQHLSLRKCSFIFATHLHEIVDYPEISELSTVIMKHMSVIYDKESGLLVYDRKFRDGPGNNMYGLEVCKSLSLPQEFIETAYQIRSKYSPEYSSILGLKTSHYNANKIVGTCEKCGLNMGTEVHHLQHQAEANDDGIIYNSDGVFHKNNLANLMTLCTKCHDETHKQDKTNLKTDSKNNKDKDNISFKRPIKKRVKTSCGYSLSDDLSSITTASPI